MIKIENMAIIQKSGLLKNKHCDLLKNLSEELEETLETAQIHRTRTEMEVSVLNDIKHPTPASKYWQSVREQKVMFQEVTMLSFNYREEKVKAQILFNKIKEEANLLKKELLQIKLERKIFILKEMKRVAIARIREIRDWSDIKKREIKSMSLEELANVDNHQLISYTRRWINQTIEMGQNGSPSERQNLLGQLKSGVALCAKKDILNKVLEDYNEDIKRRIYSYGVIE